MSEATVSGWLSGWVKFILLAAIPGYLAIDFARATFSDTYAERKRLSRETLCVQYVDEKGMPNPVLERERMNALPVTVLDKLHLFFTCADPVKVKIAGVELEGVTRTLFTEAMQDTEILARLQRDLSSIEAALNQGDDVDPIALRSLASDLSSTLKAEVEVFEAVVEETELAVLDPDALRQNWWLIVGAHADQAAATRSAVAMVQQLSRSGVQGAKAVRVVEREGLLRTVVAFRSRAEAREALTRLEPALKFGGYVRAVADWCPVPISGDPLATDVIEIRCQ